MPRRVEPTDHYQPPQAIYTFKGLHAACEARGLRATLHMFDCGETITVYDGATVVVMITAECGDAVPAADRVALWLMRHKWVTPFDFKSDAGA